VGATAATEASGVGKGASIVELFENILSLFFLQEISEKFLESMRAFRRIRIQSTVNDVQDVDLFGVSSR